MPAEVLDPEQDQQLQTLLGSGFKVRDALEQIVELKAFVNLVQRRDAVLRAFLRTEAKRVLAETGGVMNVPVKGLGRALMTEPTEKLIVTDDVAWWAYLAKRYPSRVLSRPTVRAARLLNLVGHDADLEARLRAEGVLEDEVLPDAGIADEVLKGSGRTSAGGLVDPVTGEMIPAVAQLSGASVLQVKADAAAIKRAEGRILADGIDPALPRLVIPPILQQDAEV